MKIALVHSHYDEDKLTKVINEMQTMGAPDIHAVWMDVYNHWQALEGCHRVRAAKALSLTPNIIEVDYSDDMASTIIGYDGDEDYKISEICDDGYKAIDIEFED